MLRHIFALVALLTVGATQARADALPMPQTLDEFQGLLIGIWDEQGAAYPAPGMLGHSQVTRVITFGNSSFGMLFFSSIAMVNEFNGGAMVGTWKAERVDDKTLKVTMSQDPEHGTTYLLVFDGDNAFVMTDAEQSYLIPSRFVRRGVRVDGGGQ